VLDLIQGKDKVVKMWQVVLRFERVFVEFKEGGLLICNFESWFVEQGEEFHDLMNTPVNVKVGIH